MKGFPEIIAEVDFNWDKDNEEFGTNNRIVSVAQALLPIILRNWWALGKAQPRNIYEGA